MTLYCVPDFIDHANKIGQPPSKDPLLQCLRSHELEVKIKCTFQETVIQSALLA